MSGAPHDEPADAPVRSTPQAGREPRADWPKTLLLVLAIAGLLAAAVHPLRRYVVEPRRQALLGYHEPPGRRLALASQFAFDAARGSSLGLVPGGPALGLGDIQTYAVVLVLGGFRGPYVIWLWVKSEEEKQRKIHFDLMDRYTKIAAFQGDYPAVWTFLSWNIVWNVSVQWQSLDRKYEWIRRGAEFLTQGYRKNPHSAEIMVQMGLIYSQKLGLSQESSYYRRRAREDDGRSVFLTAYEWFDRARKANDRYASLGRGLAKPVAYSQACHNLSYYAQESTQEAYDTLRQSVDARQGGREAEARKAFEAGAAKLAEAASAWAWSRREWHDHIVRFEKEGLTADMIGAYRRFYGEADTFARQLEDIRTGLTYENLPERLATMARPEIK